MNLFEFMSEHPILTFVLAVIAANTIIGVALAVAQ